jgi:hypothetical protein
VSVYREKIDDPLGRWRWVPHWRVLYLFTAGVLGIVSSIAIHSCERATNEQARIELELRKLERARGCVDRAFDATSRYEFSCPDPKHRLTVEGLFVRCRCQP